MGYKYWLPDEKNHQIFYESANNSVIIAGKNGAGKSKLGVWIENQNPEKVYRIKAYGSTKDDVEQLLNIAKGRDYKKIAELWQMIFADSKIKLVDSRVWLAEREELFYSLIEKMSDGERLGLILVMQVLAVPTYRTIVIDAPERYFNNSLAVRFCAKIEQARRDSLFIYLTTSTSLVSEHSRAAKVWISDYDGEHWKYQLIENNVLSEEIVFKILQQKKHVLFIEGEPDSYDAKIYSAIYRHFNVIPSGGCTQVIERTETFKNNSSLKRYKGFGLIDRDYRSESEIQELASKGIFALKVAEVENLYLVEEVFRIVAKYRGVDVEKAVKSAKEYVVKERFASNITQQMAQAIIAEIRYRLSQLSYSGKTGEEIIISLSEGYDEIDFQKICKDIEVDFEGALIGGDYKRILVLFNKKDVIKSIGRFFGVSNHEYTKLILELVEDHNTATAVELKKAMLLYLPEEISWDYAPKFV